MNILKKSLFFSLLTVLVIALSGCATKGTKDGSETYTPENVGAEGFSLELNGDSDTRKAGALQSIYFPFDSNTITSTSAAILKANAEYLSNNSAIKIQIEGHCDERGSIQYNLALGERRAKAVRDYLIGEGVSSSRIEVISYGKERPVAYGHDNSAWAKNRRANFVVTDK